MTPERFHKLRERLARRQPDLTVLAEDVHKSHNIAAILRSADAVGIHELHAVSSAGEFRHHHMVSGGTRKWVPVTLHDDTRSAIAVLKAEGLNLVAAHPSDDAADYRDVDYTAPTAILLGAELTGVSQTAKRCADTCVRIPMEGMVASLNVSVAAALILFEARRQREAAGFYNSCRIPEKDFRRRLFEWAYPELAERCRERDLPYPDLGADGDLLENPFEPRT